jgi:hypothetical protein
MFAAIDSWLFLLFVAIALLLRWLASKATPSDTRDSSQDQPKTPQGRPAHQAPLSDEEQIRKFLEALGQPKTSKPPPPVTPRTDMPPRPVAPVRPPPSMLPIPPRPIVQTRRKVIEPERIPKAPEQPSAPSIPAVLRKLTAQPSAPPRISEPAVEAYVIAPTETTTDQFKIDVHALLASPSRLRNAIILREVFGPPRSLQPLEELPGIA